jgi:hypothetical protein
MKRLVLVLSMAAIAAIALAAGLAQAKPMAYPTSTSVEVKKTTLAGKISSSKASCLKGRTVHGEWHAPGAHLITEAASSDSSGKWVLQFEVAPGSKGELTISVAPKQAGGVTCKGFSTAQVVAK